VQSGWLSLTEVLVLFSVMNFQQEPIADVHSDVHLQQAQLFSGKKNNGTLLLLIF